MEDTRTISGLDDLGVIKFVRQLRSWWGGWLYVIAAKLYPRLLLLETELAIARAAAAAANVDPLTGANTRATYERFKDSPAAAELHQVVVDIDSFGEVNNSLGHRTGDRVLQYVGEYIRIICGTYELSIRQRFYRYGGDELVIFVEPQLVQQVARSIEKMIAAKLRPAEFENLPRITVSCGHGTDFVAADNSMYRRKQAGKMR
jgi:diguanylate cyclase (GGDEF)-like protein